MKGIYSMHCKENNKHYIGYTNKSFNWRKWKHFNELKKGINNKYLQEDYNKYGEQAFEFIELLDCENLKLDEIKEKEKLYIIKYNSLYPNGYNIAKGSTNKGIKWSDEQKAKLSKIQKGKNKGKNRTEEFKKERSIKYKKEGNPMYGKLQTRDTKKKLSMKKTNIDIEEQSKQIKFLLLEGKTAEEISLITKVSKKTIYKIRQGKHWMSDSLNGGYNSWIK